MSLFDELSKVSILHSFDFHETVFEGLKLNAECGVQSSKGMKNYLISYHLVLVQQTGLQLALLRRGVDLRQIAAVLVVVYYSSAH